MDYKKLTKIFIPLATLAIIAFDAYVFMGGSTEATISYTVMMWSYEYPIMTFSVGVLCGHLFWRTRDVKKPSDSSTSS